MMMESKKRTDLVLLLFLLAGLYNVKAEVPTDTYQQTCELPNFEWAAYGTRLTGRMYTRRAAILGDSLFAAGYLKSTSAPNAEDYQELPNDFGVTGPYTTSDPSGANANSVTADLIDYTTEFGSFAQYEVGVVKINAVTGSPEDIYVYYGEGQDETCGLAAKEIGSGEKVLAISGHYVGSLTADHSDGTKTTILNSNANGTADYVQHPNAVKNGFDDGFVISADAATGDANWLISYPISTKDAQTVGVDIDSEGNIFGAGYSCNLVGDTTAVICDGFVAMFDKADGSIVWENIMTDLAAAMWLVYDETDNALYVTGTTTYKGDGSDGKLHPSCNHDTCAVTMRLSASDGTIEWVRTVQGSPRWNFFDQTGDIRLANDLDGPYIYVALDDAGENGAVSMDEGTPYAGCLSADGVMTPEYSISSDKVITAADCAAGSTFVSRVADNAVPAADAATGAMCGKGHETANTCIMKYNKYTGLPVWGTDTPPVASLVPSVDGQSVTAVGFYWTRSGVHFDSVELPDYNDIEGSFNAKINAATGEGEYVMHSGGVGKNRPYDAVGDLAGNVYIVGYSLSRVVNWGGTLETYIIEEGKDQDVVENNAGVSNQMGSVPNKSGEYQFFAVKLAESEPVTPTCIETCSLTDGKIANPVIKADTCLIDNHCYEAGDSAAIFGRPCLVCDPTESQTDWSFAPFIGESVCFIDNVCRAAADPKTFRESRSVTHVSECQLCTPAMNATGWSVRYPYELTGEQLPNDCAQITVPVTPGGVSLCFSGESTVETASGGVVAMKHIRIGDQVKVAENSFERVYGFGHFDETSTGKYIVINKGIEISEDHLLHIHGKGFVPAGSVEIGDMMLSGAGENVAVKSLGAKNRMGMYAPFTPSGKIVVNGIVASSFTTIQPGLANIAISGYSTGIPHAWAAHKFEFVHRLFCHYLGNTCPDESYTEDGVSTWVSEPRKMFNWLLLEQTNVVVAFGIMIPILSVFTVFAFLEGFLLLFTASPTPLGGIIMVALVVVIGVTTTTTISRKKKV